MFRAVILIWSLIFMAVALAKALFSHPGISSSWCAEYFDILLGLCVTLFHLHRHHVPHSEPFISYEGVDSNCSTLPRRVKVLLHVAIILYNVSDLLQVVLSAKALYYHVCRVLVNCSVIINLNIFKLDLYSTT